MHHQALETVARINEWTSGVYPSDDFTQEDVNRIAPEKREIVKLHYQFDCYLRAATEVACTGAATDFNLDEILNNLDLFFDEKNNLDPDYQFTTDFSGTYGWFGSPWNHPVNSAEEALMFILAFSLETDECAYDLDEIEASLEMTNLARQFRRFAVAFNFHDEAHLNNFFSDDEAMTKFILSI